MCRPVLFLWEREDRERDAREACASCRRGFVGGCLLGCRNSAKTASKILKLASEAAQTAESVDRQHTPHGLAFQGGSVCGGLLGSWMSRQRCAGRLVGEAEFACGLTVGVWGRRRCAGRQGGKVGVPCDLMGVSE